MVLGNIMVSHQITTQNHCPENHLDLSLCLKISGNEIHLRKLCTETSLIYIIQIESLKKTEHERFSRKFHCAKL
jgi:hypothetical protein